MGYPPTDPTHSWTFGSNEKLHGLHSWLHSCKDPQLRAPRTLRNPAWAPSAYYCAKWRRRWYNLQLVMSTKSFAAMCLSAIHCFLGAIEVRRKAEQSNSRCSMDHTSFPHALVSHIFDIPPPNVVATNFLTPAMWYRNESASPSIAISNWFELYWVLFWLCHCAVRSPSKHSFTPSRICAETR